MRARGGMAVARGKEQPKLSLKQARELGRMYDTGSVFNFRLGGDLRDIARDDLSDARPNAAMIDG